MATERAKQIFAVGKAIAETMGILGVKVDDSFPRLRFQGQDFILVNERGNRNEGAIATVEAFENFEPSYAHLMEDGTILRNGQKIGTKDDIEWLPSKEKAVDAA